MSQPQTPILSAPAGTGGVKPPLLTLRPPRGWTAIHLGDIWQFRDLLFTLAARDLKIRYKQTALGVIWVVLQPLLAAGIFSIVFGTIAKFPSEGVAYFLFSYIGMLAWNLFNTVLTRSSTCLTGNSQLISKVYFPRLILPLSTIGSALVDFAVAAALLVVLMVWYHVPLTLAILLTPLWTAAVLMLAMGIGLVAAALTVSYRDVQYILPVALNILLYASPVAYPATYAASRLGPTLQKLYFLNPLAGVLQAFSWSLLAGSPKADPLLVWPAVYAVLSSLVLLWLGAVAFKQMERKFADVI
jgi:lipopolysaccharide transport system permease protein